MLSRVNSESIRGVLEDLLVSYFIRQAHSEFGFIKNFIIRRVVKTFGSNDRRRTCGGGNLDSQKIS
jgi:hypothetical protein